MNIELSITSIALMCIVWFIFRKSIKTFTTHADIVVETSLQHVNDIIGVNALESQVDIQRRSKDALANLGSSESFVDPLAEYRKLRGLKH